MYTGKCPEVLHRGDLASASSPVIWIPLAGLEMQPQGWKAEMQGNAVPDSKMSPKRITKSLGWGGSIPSAVIAWQSILPLERKFTLLTRAIQFPLLRSIIGELELFSVQVVACGNPSGLFLTFPFPGASFSSGFLVRSRRRSISSPSQQALLEQLLKQLFGWGFVFLQFLS